MKEGKPASPPKRNRNMPIWNFTSCRQNELPSKRGGLIANRFLRLCVRFRRIVFEIEIELIPPCFHVELEFRARRNVLLGNSLRGAVTCRPAETDGRRTDFCPLLAAGVFHLVISLIVRRADRRST